MRVDVSLRARVILVIVILVGVVTTITRDQTILVGE